MSKQTCFTLCITHIKPLTRAALTWGPHKTFADGSFYSGRERRWRCVLKDSFNQLFWFEQPAEEGTAQGNTWGGKEEWMHNPITLFFSSCQSTDWRNGAQKHFCSSPPCKAKQMPPLNFPPHFLNSAPCLQGPGLHPDHLRAEHSSCTHGGTPALPCLRTQLAQGTWNGTTEEKPGFQPSGR